jgi:hypothetical protein
VTDRAITGLCPGNTLIQVMDSGAATVFMAERTIPVHNEADNAARGVFVMAG